jgi:hypothetical protein
MIHRDFHGSGLFHPSSSAELGKRMVVEPSFLGDHFNEHSVR